MVRRRKISRTIDLHWFESVMHSCKTETASVNGEPGEGQVQSHDAP